MTRRAAALALGVWLAALAACALIVSRVQIGADLSAFLPRHPTPEQRLLTDQLRDGVVSRLLLVGIEGGSAEALAAASRALAGRLATRAEFASVNNGDEATLAPDYAFLRDHRYVLSPAVTAGRFDVAGIRSGIENSLQVLASPLGMMVKDLIPRDPTGEIVSLLEGYAGQARPATRDGVWASADGGRALLLVQTTAAGYDIDAQQQALARIDADFAAVRGAAPGASSLQLVVSGPAVFAVRARTTIEGVATRFSIVTTLLIGALMLLVYRSPRVLMLSLLPVASGALAGIAAVSLGYGIVYGVTLGFGITLIGEAIDYAIYFFARLTAERPADAALTGIWPTLRLGMLTSICGFAAMLFGGFPGLAQLGLFSIVGLVTAILVTRWVLPALVPAGFTAPGVGALAPRVTALFARAPAARWLVWVAVGAACVVFVLRPGPFWSHSLASLSPIAEADQRLDQSLRNDLGAPDVRYLVVATARDEQAALEHAEAIDAALAPLVKQGALGGYESPARWLPSERTQRARLAALPDAETARARLAEAVHGLPVRAETFAPFVAELDAARRGAPITRADLRGTHFALQVDSLLVRRGADTLAVLPLRGVGDVGPVARAIDAAHMDGSVVLDLRDESDRLYQTYLREAIVLSLAGAAAIVVLLFASLREVRRVVAVLLPLATAVFVTLALVALLGKPLLLFHLIGVLLAVAVGSNYALFFDRERAMHAGLDGTAEARTMASLLLANASTVIGFGMLSFSGVPVLSAIGETVGIGAVLSLVFSAILMGRRSGAVR